MILKILLTLLICSAHITLIWAMTFHVWGYRHNPTLSIVSYNGNYQVRRSSAIYGNEYLRYKEDKWVGMISLARDYSNLEDAVAAMKCGIKPPSPPIEVSTEGVSPAQCYGKE